MKVLIVGNPVFDTHYSIHAFQQVLAEGLAQRGHQAPKTNAGLGRRVKGGWLATRFEKFVRFPLSLRKVSRGFDVLHICEQGYASYARWSRAPVTTITCHDLIVAKAARGEISDWPVSGRGRVYQESILRDLAQARAVICDSQATRSDVLRLSACTPEQAILIYIGFCRPQVVADREQAKAILQQAGIDHERPFFVHVSGPQPNKNRPGLIRIYEVLQRQLAADVPELIIAGAPLDEAQQALGAKLPLPERLRSIVRPSDEVVQALMTLAEMLIFPSLYEGFGLPIIEAQRQGCPVATTSWGPMDEVAGPGAVLVDPNQHEPAASMILMGLQDRDALISAGLRNIERFETERMVADYEQLFTRLLTEVR